MVELLIALVIAVLLLVFVNWALLQLPIDPPIRGVILVLCVLVVVVLFARRLGVL